VFHLAAQPLVRRSYAEPVETIGTNVMGTVNVLESLRALAHPVACVVVTSDKCYENREVLHGYHEDDALGGHDPYSGSKGAAEIVAHSYRRSYFMAADSPVRMATARVAIGRKIASCRTASAASPAARPSPCGIPGLRGPGSTCSSP
jgi:CDP-glucose 4,6-dehydratase